MPVESLSLRDIHLPDAIGWWPPAIAWWCIAILIPSLIILTVYLYKLLTRQTAIKTAKKRLLEIKQDSVLNDGEKLIAISAILRRVAMSISAREQTASLNGQAWLQYLDNSVPDSAFTLGVGKCLADAHYRKTAIADLDIPSLINLCENWLSVQKENKK